MKKLVLVMLLICTLALCLSACDKTDKTTTPTQSTTVESCDHAYSEWIVVTQPSCTAQGMQMRVCTLCQEQEWLPIAVGHSLGDDDKCTLCGLVFATEGVVYQVSDDGTYAIVTEYSGTATNVKIVDSYEGLPVTTIGVGGFYRCSNLTSIIIPDSVTTIGDSAFSGCSNLPSIIIPDSVTSIGSKAFLGCSNLTSIVIPDSVTAIGEEVFHFCSNLTSIIIPDSVTTIGNYAFWSCTKLASVTLGNSVTTIGNYAFRECSSLTSIIIPDSVTTIGDYAFRFCSNLTNITVAAGNSNYCSIDGNLYSKDGKTLEQYAIGKLDTRFTIPDSVTTIGSRAFYECSNLTSITIPNSVTTIDDSAFYDCPKLTYIAVVKGNPNYRSIDGNLYSKDGKTLVQYAIGKTDTGFTVPNSVSSIGVGAFAHCFSLTSVTLPDSVTTIGEGAFQHCSYLTSVTLGNSVTAIGDSAFYDCFRLRNVYYIGSAKEWAQITIGADNSKLTGATIHYNYVPEHKE